MLEEEAGVVLGGSSAKRCGVLENDRTERHWTGRHIDEASLQAFNGDDANRRLEANPLMPDCLLLIRSRITPFMSCR